MAYHFSANQFENQYSGKRLQNWELPKWYPPRPRTRKGPTKIVADSNGHLFPDAPRWNNNPWGYFRGTYELPLKITRTFSCEYNECLQGRYKWQHFPQKQQQPCELKHVNLTDCRCLVNCPTKCQAVQPILRYDPFLKQMVHACEVPRKPDDLEYIPGDLTPFHDQHESRALLLDQKYERDNHIEPEYQLDKNYLGEDNMRFNEIDEPDSKFTPPLPTVTALTSPLISPPIDEDALPRDTNIHNNSITMPFSSSRRSVADKPNERCPSPVVPAVANFELAKRMHQDNLDHQPLPDCIAAMAYRKLQIDGGHGGLALDIDPIATGVGLKTHNIGPTHCTKMRVYRPKTCGVVPKPYEDGLRFAASAEPNKKMGAMDLAIGWDYRPANPLDEPRPPRHIDGLEGSAGPAVFTCVKTPRDDPTPSRGRSAGVFNNTLGEADFFDKDIMRRKTDFVGESIADEAKCSCGTDHCPVKPIPRASSVSRDLCDLGPLPDRYEKKYQSSPNICSTDIKALREKYLGTTDVIGPKTGCRRGLFQRARTRLCHKVAPEPVCSHLTNFERQMPCKAAFRAGVPKYNAAGQFVSSDSGCSFGSHNSQRILVVPRPRNPYSKRNYDIDTLVPPFRCLGGGANEGGYPEHWRLASVYQHAYKPLEQRRRPLIHTVYK